MGEGDQYRATLRRLEDWGPYLAANSHLPGPRANLELVAACGEEADLARAEGLIAGGDEFATVCGLVALGRYFGAGDDRPAEVLHGLAADDRWRVREGVAMALQRACDADLERGFALAELWALDFDPLARRAAVAAVCEPRLLRDPGFAGRALALLARVTAELARVPPRDRGSAPVRTLRQALGYGWSVAVAASPKQGLPLFRGLEASPDPDIGWIVRENRKKARLRRVLLDWEGSTGGVTTAPPSPPGGAGRGRPAPG
jgi:hypothetical protein